MSRTLLFFVSIFFISLFACNNSNRGKENVNNLTYPESYLENLDTTLIENSGLLYWNKLLWTFNDSGGKNELYGFNSKTGNVEITLQISNTLNIDWEDIAQDKEHIYIAETGNNLGDRKDLKILKIKKSEINKDVFQKIKAEEIRYKYAEQTCFVNGYKQHCFDCEGLIAYKDTLYLFSKDWVNNITKAYAMPIIPGEYTLHAIDSFDVKGLITGADITAKGKLALVGYRDYKSFVWVFKKTDKRIFNQAKSIFLDSLINAQTEGICFDRKGNLLISCEITESHPPQVWSIKSNYFK